MYATMAAMAELGPPNCDTTQKQGGVEFLPKKADAFKAAFNQLMIETTQSSSDLINNLMHHFPHHKAG